MLLLFQLIAICSIWTLGIKIATAKGMVLEKLGEWGEKKVEEGYKIYEALFVCHWCMPSIHSLVAIEFAFGIGIIEHFTWNLLAYYPLVVMGTSMLNGLIWGHHEKTNAAKEFYQSGENAADAITDSIYAPHEEEYEEHFNHQHN